MHSYLLTIAYHGAGFAGWQRQAGFPTVQGELEDALATIVGEPVVVHGSGRTDAGVHALRQCAHVRLSRPFEPSVLLRAINGNLPGAVRVREVCAVPGEFHARFSASGKRYAYRCLVDRVLPVFGRGLFHWVRRPVDIDSMRAAAGCLRGRHDFAAFATNPGYERKFGTVRTIRSLHIVRRPHGFDLVTEGDGFLYNMVRAIAGTILEVGTGKRTPEDVAHVLASGDRRRAGENAPPEGLYLLRVLYPAPALRMAGPSVEDDGVRIQPPTKGRTSQAKGATR